MHARSARLVALALLVSLAVAAMGLMAFAPTASADHDTIVWSRYWGVTFDVRYQLFPTSFADGRGSVYFFYYDENPSNGNTNVSVAKYATRGANGNPQLQFIRQVNPTLPNNAIWYNWYGVSASPSVAMDHNGNLYVAWADRNWNVYVSKSVDGGASWGAPSRVDPVGANSYDSGPSLVAAPSGTLYVAWIQYWLPGGVHNITVARSTDQGVTWANKVNVTTYGTASTWTDTLAVDSFNRLYLVYTSASSFPNWHVNYTWSNDGTVWSSPTRLDGGSYWAYFPTVAVDASNRVHVLWYDGRQSPNQINTYWYRRSDDRGASWTMEMPVSQGVYQTGGGSLPTLAVHGDTVIAGWTAYSGAITSLGYAISADAGDLWYPERLADFGTTTAYIPTLSADENGTFYASFYRWNEFLSSYDLGFSIWDGPPSTPTITGIVRGSTSLTVSWSASPEGDVGGYRLWRSSDGVSYELAGTFDASTQTYADTGLTNGTYWYRVTSFDVRGTSSHSSAPMSATVGKTTAEMVADIESQIAALQAQLDSAQGDITAIQAQLNSLQTDLNNLEQQSGTQYTDLQSRINNLQSQLNAIQAEKATQAESYLNTLLIVVVIVLLVFMLMQSRKMAAMRAQMSPPASGNPGRNPPPSDPSMSPPPPSLPSPPSEPGLPEDEL